MKFKQQTTNKHLTILSKKLVLFISSLFLISCSNTTTTLSIASPSAETLALNIMTPTLNEQHSVKRGGVMSHHETGFYLSTLTKSIELVNDVNSATNDYPSIKSGAIVKLSKDINGISGACFEHASYDNNQVTFCLLDNNADGIFDQGVFNGNLAENIQAQYKVNTHEVKSNYSQQVRKQLIYRGITIDKIKFTYLEFNSDMTTPSLKKDFTIGNHRENHILFDYKGAHFKILKADNVNITFENIAFLK